MAGVNGKRILITAAGNGIGRACAVAFSGQGAMVTATDVDHMALVGLDHEDTTTAVLDATDPAALAGLIKKAGPFDCVIHCVGYVHQGTVLECSPEEWRRSFEINVDSFYVVLQAVLPGMVTNGGGSLVSIASVASSIKGLPNRAAYGATKAAMIGLTKAVAADYAAHNIRCNAVCPGTVDTPSLRGRVEVLSERLGETEAMRMFTSRQPLGRIGTAEEIAALCLYLASDESAFMTGQAIAIDGGISI